MTTSQTWFYERIIRPLLFKFDPEAAHGFICQCLSSGLLSFLPCQYTAKDLEVDFCGIRLANPVGLAAGFDKNGKLVSMLSDLGFGFAEIGSVCARPHGGNTLPRLFRLPEDNALINRLGLNGLGAEVIAQKLANYQHSLPIGINIAKTNDPFIQGKDAVADLLYTFSRIKSLPIHFVTLNASCPNTEEGCLKEISFLNDIFHDIQNANQENLPLFVKLSPDSNDELLAQIAELAKVYGLAGFVCGNTTISRESLMTSTDQLAKIGQGGLSGTPLKQLNLNLCRKIYKLKSPKQIIIGVGGINTGQDAYDYILAGATTLQLYTALIYRGPNTVKAICQELSALLHRDRLSLSSAIGSGNK